MGAGGGGGDCNVITAAHSEYEEATLFCEKAFSKLHSSIPGIIFLFSFTKLFLFIYFYLFCRTFC